jgi:hypothetical protein
MPPHRGEQLLHVIEIANNVRVRYILSTSGYHPDARVNAQALGRLRPRSCHG